MNRRAFLSSSGAATAALASTALVNPRSMSAQAVESDISNVFHAAAAANSILVANSLYSQPQATDFAAASNTFASVAEVWRNNGFDALLHESYFGVQALQLNGDGVDFAGLRKHMGHFNPLVKEPDLRKALAYLRTVDPSILRNSLDSVQRGGLLPHITNLSVAFGRQAVKMGIPAHVALTSGVYHQSQHPHLLNTQTGCQDAAAGLLAAGTAIAVLTVMTAGAAPVLMMGFWGAVVLWGGSTVAVGALAEAVVCNF